MSEQPKCELCGEPMPLGEEMFKFHGYSGPCPKPPLPQKPVLPIAEIYVDAGGARVVLTAGAEDRLAGMGEGPIRLFLPA